MLLTAGLASLLAPEQAVIPLDCVLLSGHLRGIRHAPLIMPDWVAAAADGDGALLELCTSWGFFSTVRCCPSAGHFASCSG